MYEMIGLHASDHPGATATLGILEAPRPGTEAHLLPDEHEVWRQRARLVGFAYRLLADYVECRGGGEVLLDEVRSMVDEALAARPLVYVHGVDDTLLVGVAVSHGHTEASPAALGLRPDPLEWWIIDPTRQRVHFWTRTAVGEYAEAALEPDGVYRSCGLVGLWLNVGWLWQRPLPTMVEVRRLWDD